MFWTTKQLAEACGLGKYDIWYLRRKNPKELVPAFEAGRIHFWLPSTVETVKNLRARFTKRGRPRKTAATVKKG